MAMDDRYDRLQYFVHQGEMIKALASFFIEVLRIERATVKHATQTLTLQLPQTR